MFKIILLLLLLMITIVVVGPCAFGLAATGCAALAGFAATEAVGE